MKHYAELNYYNLLDVPTTANKVRIQRAYEIAKKTFGEESIATYSLFDAALRKQIMERVEEAFAVLSDEERRYQYDLKLGLKVAPVETPGVVSRSPSARQVLDTTPPHENTLPQGQDVGGDFLKQLRERQGIPLQEVAAKTRINITYLQFIEQDHFKGLPAEVYLRGYLVQYAEILGLDPDQVADRYLSLYHNWKKTTKLV
jgi:hypothetical protein